MKISIGCLLVLSACLGLVASARAQTCVLNNGPDLIVGDLYQISNYSAADGYDALSFGTVACNVGDVNLEWIASNNRHPVMGSSLYRLKDNGQYWTMEQVGRSWLKHGFLALSMTACCSNCSSTDGTELGTGCSSPNTAASNSQQAGLGPTWQVDAFTGSFPFPPASPPWSGPTARRLAVAIADLEPSSPATRYFGEAHFVTADDALAGNGANNASYRETSVTGSGTSWTFALAGSTVREAPALRAWVDSGVDPNVELVDADVPGEGHLVLGCSVTELPDGTWHYEYALYNMSSDDALRSFSVPIGAGAFVTGLEFHGLPYRSGDGPGSVDFDATPWTATVAGDAITFEVVGSYDPPLDVAHNALRWGSTMNFRFDSSSAPVAADVELVTYKTETAYSVAGVKGPGGAPSFCDAADGSLAACPCAPGAPDTGCEVAQTTGGVHLALVAQELAPNRVTWQGTGFSATGMPTALVIRATELDAGAPVVFGDGLRCIGTPLVRLAAAFAAGGASTHAHGHGAAAGSGAFYYQLWFRNTPAMYCTPDAFNLSDGRVLVW